MNFCQEFELLIRARYPLIYVISAEETRLQDLIVGMGHRRQKKVFEWSCSMGMVPAGTSIQSNRARSSTSKDPLVALEQVIDQVEPAIFIFKDLHPYLTKSHFPVVRRLKEIAQQLKHSQKTIVIISSVVEVPPEIEKEITLLSFPLPSREDLRELFDRIVEEVKVLGQVRIDPEPEGREKLLQAALGLTLSEAENVFAKIMVKSERLSGEDVSEVLWEKQQLIRKNGLLEYYEAQESFGEVGGLAALKEWLQKRSVAFGSQAREFGLPWPKGVMLIGVQGCGKSLCAKAVAASWQLPLLRFDAGRMFGSFVGSSEENMRRAISVAESVAPAVLWVDEIDKAFAGMHGGGSSDSGTSARVFGTFLTWLSEKQAAVFVVATANEIGHLPPELMRKGRFDELFFVDLPSERERQEVFGIHLRKRNRDPAKFDLAALAASSEQFSGAEIEQVVISGMFDAFSEGSELAMCHLIRALGQTVPLAATMDGQISKLRRWAEGRARGASETSLRAGRNG